MVDSEYIPGRGDIVWIDFTPQKGHEHAGRRPAIVLSPEGYNKKVGLGLFCPITRQEKGYPFEVALPLELSVSGVVLADQIKSLDWVARNATFICRLDERRVLEILRKASILLG